MQWLLSNGADQTIKNNEGETPLDRLKDTSSDEIKNSLNQSEIILELCNMYIIISKVAQNIIILFKIVFFNSK